MTTFAFDATAVEPEQRDFSPLPAGVYTCQIIESDVKPLKSGNGEGLSLTYEVLEGQFARRRVWQNINVRHTSPEAQRIGQGQLSALCRAVGVPRLTDTTQLHMRPLRVRLKIRQDSQYGDKNEVSAVEPMAGGAGLPPAAPAARPPVAAAAPAAPVAPWAAARPAAA